MPRPKMPDGLYVSVSQVKTWLMCPRKYELKYIRGVAPAFVPVNLAFGSAFHEALAGYYNEIKSRASRSGGTSSWTPSGQHGRRPRRGTSPSRPTKTTALIRGP